MYSFKKDQWDSECLLNIEARKLLPDIASSIPEPVCLHHDELPNCGMSKYYLNHKPKSVKLRIMIEYKRTSFQILSE